MKSIKVASLLLAALAVLAVPLVTPRGSARDIGAPPFPPPHLVG
jgi:hypothetical protein